jgi:uroporphyrinogen-III synthase
MTALDGWTVVVTRPAAQSARMLASLEAAGARTLRWPTISIEPLALDADARERWSPERYDCVIYTSANAVELAAKLWPRPRGARVAAIGQATARALQANGIEVRTTPGSGSGSEALLATMAFTSVQGQRILIVRGRGGRELLRDTLAARGADVTIAELYVRRALRPDAASLERLRAAIASAPRLAVTVTSVDILAALLEPLPADLRGTVERALLVVPAERIAVAARDRRWSGPVVVAASAEDEVMTAALLDAADRGTP